MVKLLMLRLAKFTIFVLRIVLSLTSIHDPVSPTGTLMKGPVNQTVHLGDTVQFHCRVHDRPMQEIVTQSYSAKHLTVQWIINGFGVTNETLRAVYDSRYHMPGPSEQGIYDLELFNVRLEDEASFLCQADVRVQLPQERPIVETLTTQPVYLTVVVPPNRLYMRQLHKDSQGSDGLLNTRFNIADGDSHDSGFSAGGFSQLSTASRIVADDPTTVSGRSVLPDTNSSSFTMNHTHASKAQQPPAIWNEDRTKQPIPTLWIREQEKLTVECRSASSKPASKLIWLLSGVPLIKTQRGQPSNPEFTPPLFGPVNEKPSEEFQIRESHTPYPTPHQLNEAKSSDEVSTKVTISVLELLVQKHHRNQQLACRVANSADFLTSSLPTVVVILQPMYIDKVRVQLPSSPGADMREGNSVDFLCTAITNPSTAKFGWTLISPEQYANQKFPNHSRKIYPSPTIAGMKEKPLTNLTKSQNSLHLRLHRALHKSIVRCWVGISQPDDFHKEDQRLADSLKQMWTYTDLELDILYGAVFFRNSENIRAGLLGQTVYVDCVTEANPAAQVWLYKVGPEGQALLTDLSVAELEDGNTGSGLLDKASNDSNLRQMAVFRREISRITMTNAMKSEGTKMLASNTHRIHHPVQLTTDSDFGFYVCMARNHGFQHILRHVYVGKPGPPSVTHVVQQNEKPTSVVYLMCFIRSVPRPKPERVLWLRDGTAVQPNERVQMFQEELAVGVLSVLLFRELRPTDVALYNCTTSNDFGGTWKTVPLIIDNKFPLMFLVGSAGAALLALLFLIMLCFFIRHVRNRNGAPFKIEKGKHKKHSGLWPNGTTDKPVLRTQTETQPMLASVHSDPHNGFLRYDPLDLPNCHLCYTNSRAAVPHSHDILMKEMQVEVGDHGCGNANCKRSDDSGVETGPIVDSDTSIKSLPGWNTLVLHSPAPVVSMTRNSSSLGQPNRCSLFEPETYVNTHAAVYPAVGYSGSTTPIPISLYGSTRAQSIGTSPLSPILFVGPQHSATNEGEIYTNSMTTSGLLIPSVMVPSSAVIDFTPKSIPCSVVTTTSFLSYEAPYITPDLSVLPLQFVNCISVSSPSSDVGSVKLDNNFIQINTVTNPMANSEEDGTNV